MTRISPAAAPAVRRWPLALCALPLALVFLALPAPALAQCAGRPINITETSCP